MPIFTKSDKGFTLIELLVVILIIAILIAVAAPSFLGQQDKARDSLVKQALTVSRKEVKAIYVSAENQALPASTVNAVTDPSGAQSIVAELNQGEPQYEYVPFPVPATTTDISVARESDDSVSMCQQSESGIFFCLLTNETGGLEQLTGSASNVAYAADSSVRQSVGRDEDAAREALTASSGTQANVSKGGKPGWNPNKLAPRAVEPETPATPEALNTAAKEKTISTINKAIAYINTHPVPTQVNEASAAAIIAAADPSLINGHAPGTQEAFVERQVGSGGALFGFNYGPTANCLNTLTYVVYLNSTGGDKFYAVMINDTVGSAVSVDFFEISKSASNPTIGGSISNAVHISNPANVATLTNRIVACPQ